MRNHFIQITLTIKKHWVGVLFWLSIIGTVALAVPGTPQHFFAQNPVAKNTEAQALYIPAFTDYTYRSGIYFTHTQGGKLLAGLDESLGAGACIFDYDDNGWPDIFLIGGSGQTHHFGYRQWWQDKKGNRLFRNLGNAKFEDVTEKAGLEDNGSPGMGCAHADLDNDGDQDLFVTTQNGNHLYRNNGDGTFKEVTNEAGIRGKAWSTSIAIADYDGDGLLDIYVANFIKFDKRVRTLETDAGFVADASPMFESTLFDAEPNQLYHNLGGLEFRDEAQSSGVDDQGGRSLSALWLDVNDDLLPDLIVGNDRKTPSRLFLNQGNGEFIPAGEQFGINNNNGFQSLTSGDIDGDGSFDLITGTPSGELLKIFLSNKNYLTFSDRARELGLSDSRYALYSTWATGIYDFNLDGTLDLMAFNGLKLPDPDAKRIAVGQTKLFWLKRGQQLEDVSKQSGDFLLDNISARGAAFGDLDNDGDVDAMAIHNNNPAQMLINESSNRNWLGIRLEGASCNRDAIGAIVELITTSNVQRRTVTAGSGFLSDHDRRLQFGLDSNESEVSLHIIWPDGSESSHDHIPTHHYYSVKQSEQKPQPMNFSMNHVETAHPIKLLIGSKDSIFQTNLLQWLIDTNDKKSVFTVANDLMLDKEPLIRKKTMELIRSLQFDSRLLPSLESGIHDSDASVRLATILTLRAYEDENTVYWLLRALNDSDESIRIAAIETFEYFFREEESMVNKKQLAIPILVSKLADPSPVTAAAAARALGESENYRGVMPLTRLVIDSEKQQLQIQAIRSLGLLHETGASESLMAIARTPQQPPKARAHALIALKRLGEAKTNQFIRQQFHFMNRNFDASTAEIYAYLLTEENGSVFKRNVFIDKLHQWFRSQNSSADDINHLITVLSTLKSFAGEHFYNDVLPLTKSRNNEVRLNAFDALLHSPTPPSKKLIMTATSDKLSKIRNLALESAITHHLILPTEILFKLTNDSVTAKNACILISQQLSPNVEKRLVHIAEEQKQNQETRVCALSALSRSNTASAHAALKEIMFNHEEPLQIRSQALRSFATIFPGHADLIKLSRLRHDPLSLEALKTLADQHNGQAIASLWRMFDNEKEAERNRIFAANTLYTVDAQRTISGIIGKQR